MTWPTEVSNANLDSGSDSATAGRQNLEDLADAFNAIHPLFQAANGLCELDSLGNIPDNRLPYNVFGGAVDYLGMPLNLPATWTSTKISTGHYRVTCGLSGTLFVMVTSCEMNRRPIISLSGVPSYFDVTMYARANGVLGDAGFNFFVFEVR